MKSTLQTSADVTDVLGLVGGSLVVVGIALIHVPTALIVVGLMTIGVAIMIEKRRNGTTRNSG